MSNNITSTAVEVAAATVLAIGSLLNQNELREAADAYTQMKQEKQQKEVDLQNQRYYMAYEEKLGAKYEDKDKKKNKK